MSAFKSCQSSKLLLIITLLLSLIPGTSIVSIPVLAQRLSSSRNSGANLHQVIIPIGTQIPVKYDAAEKILVTKGETMPLILTVATNLRTRKGTLLIPYGSEIVGAIIPVKNGCQFVAEKIIIKDRTKQDLEQTLEATSEIITQTEIVQIGTNTDDNFKRTVIGAAAATIISSMAKNKAIETEEVLGNEGLGALAEWILDSSQVELISINPNRDLTLTLHGLIKRTINN